LAALLFTPPESFMALMMSAFSKIVKTIITLAHSLEMDAIAEGIETEYQLESLSNPDCVFVQGLLFSKPLNFNQVKVMLKDNVNFQNQILIT
jgi:EAL domain-containing protein (putative c-di-GMP-specific phosphodiesterase class I)